ncbi:phage tail tape measure protein [Bacteroides mediterraneensis]|uniref:phage tail tape measure protein n=1 Tax=Bacteroides mediterraneensis TaxID=1841856 RepID=UPI001957D452|nr:phage tail tape measure protein [Bacteroides mediterraneensis]MBM6781437.1 phage tail tape measure protein [Bacteroides mediterraneensis]
MANIFTRLLLDKSDFDANLKKAQGSISSFANTSKGIVSGLTKFGGYAAAFVGISTSIHSAVTANMEFEKSLSSLRAITGVTADELNYFRSEAIRMAMDSTQSATQMVDAYKLIGSQMPELLKNKSALTATAEAAVTLAEAAELDVPTAAKALTGSLNQMGQSSVHAAEYINILAAASQQGSADIPYLNKAIENAGGTASSVGIKFNDLVAAIEAIAPRITDAGSAGTNLRNIFLTLESSADRQLRPSVVGLSRALDNLSAKNMDATELTKMFGKESVTAAIAILQERDAFEQLRTGITDTNTAYEQARINNDNLAGSIGKLQSAWGAFINTMAGSNGIIKDIVDEIRDWVDKLAEANMSIDELFNKRTKKDKDINQDEFNKRITGYMNSGMSMTEALDKEERQVNYMYPEALKLQQRKNELQKAEANYIRAKAVNVNGVAEEERKALVEAQKTYDNAYRESILHSQILSLIKEQRKELEAKNKAEEKANDKLNTSKLSGTTENDPPKGSMAYLDNQISGKKKELSLAVNDADRIRISRELDELVSKRREMDITVKYKDLKAPGAVQKPASNLAGMATLPDKLDKIEPISDKSVKNVDDMTMGLENVSSILGTLGGLMSQSSDNMGAWALSSAANIAQMIVQLQALATAQGVASAFSAPWPASLAAVATVLTTVASIFSSLPQFAEGGIIGGSSYFGDRLLARVNSGEMILNQKQQRRLYDLTTSDGGATVSLGVSRIQGSDLYLALSNYMKKTGKKL